MMDLSLIATYIPQETSTIEVDDPWLFLKQKHVPETSSNANLEDITAMWHMAMTGTSAFNYIAERCPVSIKDGIVTVYLGLYVFPSANDLQYTLTLSNGTLGDMGLVTLLMDIDVLIPQTDEVSLEFVPEAMNIEWLTDSYNAFGEIIPLPNITVENNKLKFSASCFGVLHITCTTLAHYYPVYITVIKAETPVETEDEAKKREAYTANCGGLYGSGGLDENANAYVTCMTAGADNIKANKKPDRTGYKVTSLRASVQAVWQGAKEAKTKSLTLEIPDCVNHLLEMCDDGTTKNTSLNNTEKEPIPNIYYSTCTGNILDVQYEYVPVSKKVVKNG
jgi:hypothetical protein